VTRANLDSMIRDRVRLVGGVFAAVAVGLGSLLCFACLALIWTLPAPLQGDDGDRWDVTLLGAGLAVGAFLLCRWAVSSPPPDLDDVFS